MLLRLAMFLELSAAFLMLALPVAGLPSGKIGTSPERPIVRKVGVSSSGYAQIIKSDSHDDPVKQTEDSAAASFAKKKVLFLGCSVDRFLVDDVCSAVGGKNIVDSVITVAPSIINDPRSCVSTPQDFELAYMFHRGVNRGPYYIGKNKNFDCKGCQKGETELIIKEDAPAFAKRAFHRSPDLVVVDSSLWTLSAFGARAKAVGSVERQLQQWCEKDVDELLGWAQTAFPSSRIAFRTGPTITPASIPFTVDQNGTDHGKEYLDFMQHCVLGKMDKNRKLLGKYDVVDFHGIVDELIAAGYCDKRPTDCGNNSMFALRDHRHTSKAANLALMNAVLELVGAQKIESHKI